MAFLTSPTLHSRLLTRSRRHLCTSKKLNVRAVINTPENRHARNPGLVDDGASPNPQIRAKSLRERYSEGSAREMFARTCAQAHVSKEAAMKIETLCEHLVRAAATTNLSGVRTFPGALVVHGVDSLSLLPTLDRVAGVDDNAIEVVDVGSGAGFPGLPLAVARETWSVALVEATRKKVNYQQDAIRDLDISNAIPIWQRAEILDGVYRERYDACIARAVARMDMLAEIALPLVRVGGLFIAQKSLDDTQHELQDAKNALHRLGGEIVDVRVRQSWTEQIIHDVAQEYGEALPSGDGRKKSVVVVRKIVDTPIMYPRSHSSIKNNPL